MTDLLIHCGLHKTGSSAFQIWAMRHVNTLAAQGVHMPTALVGPVGNAVTLAQRSLTKPVATLSPDENGLRAGFIDFCRAAKGDVLISSEAFEGQLLCGLHGVALPAMMGNPAEALAALGEKADEIRQNFRNLRAVADAAGITNIRLAFVLRNFADKHSSGFAERAKQLVLKEAVFAPVARDAGFRPLAVCLRLLQDEGAHLRLGLAGSHPEGVVPLVLDLLGARDRLAGKVDFTSEVVNASIGEIGVVCALDLIARLEAQGLRADTALRYRLMDLLQDACGLIEDRPFQGFAPEQRADWQARQDALDGQLAPWLTAPDIARLGQARNTGRKSALRLDDLSPTDAAKARRVQERLADLIAAAGLPLKTEVPA